MIAEGFSLINTEFFLNRSFRLSQTLIGPSNFLGNDILYPPQDFVPIDRATMPFRPLRPSFRNAETKIQRHSQGDGACSVGDGVVLAADSFVVKSEEITDRARWRENPAHEMPSLPTSRAGGGA